MNTKFLLSLLAVSLLFTACKSSDEPSSPTPQPQSPELIGTWRSLTSNGEEILTNDRVIYSYISSTKFTMSLSRYIPDFQEFTWRNKAMGDYTYDGLHLVQSAADPGTQHVCRAYYIDDQSMLLYYDSFVDKQGVATPLQDTVIYHRVPENLGYDQLILGTWEGVSHTGLETYGDHHHRWQYHDMDRSGVYSYTYFNYDSLAGQWIAATQSSSEYNIHGNWLATRWLPQGGKLSYEWWDIDFINDTAMAWSALRYDTDRDTTYRATFTFRRIP